ncbi:MAG: hypothetical protein KJ720_08455 [Proteobacteria bacterium]|nr:hypothetical protein [Pseudomonadota bacterium]MBU1451840.1 hypothetical protein [Pseudomonadota bacterium]MBU2469035.1 hypothetical protein [Pseudomonadota bacterium]MBU2517864.1 hypothetical protein [Pseudomonadota bacterium]
MPDSPIDAPEAPQVPPPPPIMMPWEVPGAGIKAFFATAYGIMARPRWALAAQPAASWPRWAGFAVGLWLLVFLARYLLHLAWIAGPAGGVAVLLWGILGMLVQAVVFLPIYSGAVHLTLRILAKGRPSPPFALVLRLVCYSQVTTAALLLPMVGIFAHLLWNVYVLATALTVGLGQDKRSAILGVVLPMIGFFLLGMLLASLGMGA